MPGTRRWSPRLRPSLVPFSRARALFFFLKRSPLPSRDTNTNKEQEISNFRLLLLPTTDDACEHDDDDDDERERERERETRERSFVAGGGAFSFLLFVREELKESVSSLCRRKVSYV